MILGTTFVTRGAETIFRLPHGKSYDRYQLAALGVPQIKAARYLHLICQRLSITSSIQLAQRISELPSIKGIGHAAFYAALAILEHEGGAKRALEVYADAAVSKVHHNPNDPEWEPRPVMLATFKRRKPEPKKRKGKRNGNDKGPVAEVSRARRSSTSQRTPSGDQ
jgi:hypothetical protein